MGSGNTAVLYYCNLTSFSCFGVPLKNKKNISLKYYMISSRLQERYHTLTIPCHQFILFVFRLPNISYQSWLPGIGSTRNLGHSMSGRFPPKNFFSFFLIVYGLWISLTSGNRKILRMFPTGFGVEKKF